MRWLFIGAGNMASSLIGGLIGGGADTRHIAVVDPDEATCQRARDTFSVIGATSIEAGVPLLLSDAGDDLQLGIVIAVKPHIVEAVCTAMKEYVSDQSLSVQPLYISVAAGVRQSSMQAWLPNGSALVRCMPNTPALLGLGVTALYANAGCSDEQRVLAESLLSSCGTTLWVDEESALDAVTAVSGSGPAYFFYLIEHMINAGVALGLEAQTAEKLAVETAYGAASMARQGQHSAAVLRENVTSKGGTTAAALKVFDDNSTSATIHAALKASMQRAVELGDDLAP